LLAFFFFYPAWKMVFSGQWTCFMPFLLVHLAMLIFWMSLSFVHYKTFWAFLMAAAHRPNESEPMRRKRPQVEQEAISR
jgi:hypothetical protein